MNGGNESGRRIKGEMREDEEMEEYVKEGRKKKIDVDKGNEGRRRERTIWVVERRGRQCQCQDE
jgi:hypothetical protein